MLCKKWLVRLRDQAVVWWCDGLFAAVRGELSPFLPFVNITSSPGESGAGDIEHDRGNHSGGAGHDDQPEPLLSRLSCAVRICTDTTSFPVIVLARVMSIKS